MYIKFPMYYCVKEYANKTDSQNHSTGEIDLLFLNSMQTIRQWMTFNVIRQIVLQLQKQLICMYIVQLKSVKESESLLSLPADNSLSFYSYQEFIMHIL